MPSRSSECTCGFPTPLTYAIGADIGSCWKRAGALGGTPQDRTIPATHRDYQGMARVLSRSASHAFWLSVSVGFGAFRSRESGKMPVAGGTPGFLVPKLRTSATAMCNDVVFPCGYTMDADGDTINIYYGAADCSIALARSSVRALLGWLDVNGSCERRLRAEDL